MSLIELADNFLSLSGFVIKPINKVGSFFIFFSSLKDFVYNMDYQCLESFINIFYEEKLGFVIFWMNSQPSLTRGFHIFEFTLSLIYLWPQNKYWQCFCSHAQKCMEFRKTCPPAWMLLPEIKQGDSVSCFRLHSKHVSFDGLVIPRFSHFDTFGWWFHCLKWPLSVVLKCCLVILSAGRPTCLAEKIRVLDKLYSGML